MSTKLSRRKKHEAEDLELTTFLNLMVVLISFLLVTAVFSRITIQELKLPTAAGAGGAINEPPPLTVEVIVRKDTLQVQLSKNGKSSIVAYYPKSGDKYEVDKLSEYLLGVKEQNKDKMDATLLVEPDISYANVIHIMDATKGMRVPQPGSESPQKIELFPDVSIGDAP